MSDHEPRQVLEDLAHEGDCLGTLCPDCGCCAHCTDEGCGECSCNDPLCICSLNELVSATVDMVEALAHLARRARTVETATVKGDLL